MALEDGPPRLIAFYVRALVAVGLAGIAASTTFALRDARRGHVASRRTLFGSALVLVLGAAAFLASRATAADTHRQIPHRPLPSRCPPEAVVAPIQVGPCDALIENPMVLFRNGVLSIDGSAALSDSDMMNLLSNKVALWKQINPWKPFPGGALAVATGDTLVRQLPLGRLLEHGFRRIQLVTRTEPARMETATIGTVDLRPLCRGTALELDSAAAPLPHNATYEDLLRAAQDAKQRHHVLRIAPIKRY